jgi:hypothetical protein
MSMASPAESPRPGWAHAQLVWGLIFVVAAIASSLDTPHRWPLDLVLWTAGLVLGLYGCVWALIGHPRPE